MRRRLRRRYTPEDCDDGSEVWAWETVERPDWICEHCVTRNDGWRDPCGYCGQPRPEDEE